MIVVLAAEFKDNLDYYLDQVSEENQQVIIKSGEDEFLITKLTEIDRISLNAVNREGEGGLSTV